MRDENHWDSQSKARKAQNSIQHILHAEEGHVSHTHLEANNEMVLGDRDEVVRFQRDFTPSPVATKRDSPTWEFGACDWANTQQSRPRSLWQHPSADTNRHYVHIQRLFPCVIGSTTQMVFRAWPILTTACLVDFYRAPDGWVRITSRPQHRVLLT